LTARRADLLLITTTVIWGTTFAVVHTTAAQFPPLALIAVRFTIAAAALLPFLLRSGVNRRLLRNGALLGVLLFGGFALQTLGIARTTPARAGFITGLNVVFVPLLGRLLGDSIARRTLIAVGVSVLGLSVLSWGCELPGLGCSTFENSLPERAVGDRLVLLCAGVYAVHVIGVSRLTEGLPVLPLNAIQLSVVALLAGLSAWAFERPIASPPASIWVTLVYLALVCTVATFSMMLKAQPYTTPTRASLIYSLEAVFAALFSWVWIGEVPSASVWIGGALMLAAVVLMESGSD
jgi:drug/metabolite transporter (DMT)-like permease